MGHGDFSNAENGCKPHSVYQRGGLCLLGTFCARQKPFFSENLPSVWKTNIAQLRIEQLDGLHLGAYLIFII